MVLFGTPMKNSWYLNKKAVDVHFLIVSDGEQTKVSAHKMILAGASTVLNTILYDELSEENEIRIVDSSLQAFNEFLRFIYTNQLDLSTETIADVMNLANKYEVVECLDICARFLDQHLPVDKTFSGFELAMLFKQEKLKNKFGQIAEQPKAVLESKEFVNCSQNVLKSLLEIESLLCDPKNVFDACMKWTKNACEKKSLDPSISENR